MKVVKRMGSLLGRMGNVVARRAHNNTTQNHTVIATAAANGIVSNQTVCDLALNTGKFSAGTLAGTVANVTIVDDGAEVVPPGWNRVPLDPNSLMELGYVLESPANGCQCFIGSMTVKTHASRFHLDLFSRLYPEVKFVKCALTQLKDSNHLFSASNVIFFDEKDFQTFEGWFSEYLKLFTDKTNLYSYCLPPPPTTMGYSHQVRMASSHEDSLLDLVVWFHENCVENVYMLSNRLFFLNDEDAIAYKLKFC